MRTSIVALLLLTSLALAAACSSEDGTTPDCDANATEDGIQPSENGCHQFPTCFDETGAADATAIACCGEQEPMMEPDCDIVYCRYGYGVPSSEFTAEERERCLEMTTSSTSSGGGGGGGAGGGSN